MARRKGRNNKPAAILRPHKHPTSCTCDRCLDADAKQFEVALEKAWEKHNKDNQELVPYNVRVVIRESPVIGPYKGEDMGDAIYVTCSMAICGNVYPVGKRRK